MRNFAIKNHSIHSKSTLITLLQRKFNATVAIPCNSNSTNLATLHQRYINAQLKSAQRKTTSLQRSLY